LETDFDSPDEIFCEEVLHTLTRKLPTKDTDRVLFKLLTERQAVRTKAERFFERMILLEKAQADEKTNRQQCSNRSSDVCNPTINSNKPCSV